jgi:hypothetical protein
MYKKLSRVPLGYRVPVLLGMKARRVELPVGIDEDFLPPDDVEALQKKQKSRLYEAAHGYDYWYERETKLSTFEKFAKKRLENAARKSIYKRLRYMPSLRVQAVPVGEERVETKTFPGWLRRRVGRGWGAGSKSEEYFSPHAWSKTRWYVSPALLSPATREMQLKNTRSVYLTPFKRVRRGRDRDTFITEVLSTTQPNTQTALPWGKETPRWIRRG